MEKPDITATDIMPCPQCGNTEAFVFVEYGNKKKIMCTECWAEAAGETWNACMVAWEEWDDRFLNEKDRTRAARRRALSQRDKRRMEAKARTKLTHWYIVHGIYFSEDKNRPLIAPRSSYARKLKKQLNRKLRRKKFEGQRGDYKKAEEFWWAIE